MAQQRRFRAQKGRYDLSIAEWLLRDDAWLRAIYAKVEVDDRDFMVSIWAEVDRALIEHGEKPENLTRYEVMDVNGAEYLFSNYNQVQDFEIP